MMDKLLRSFSGNHSVKATVVYADDLAVILEGNSRAELEKKAAEIMMTLSQWCKNNKMRIATEKTQCALMKGTLSRDPTIRLNADNIRRTKVNKYLHIPR